MIKRLKQLTAAQKLKNKAGLSREKLSLLAKEFFGLEKIKPGLPLRILQYIVDDEGKEVLLAGVSLLDILTYSNISSKIQVE